MLKHHASLALIAALALPAAAQEADREGGHEPESPLPVTRVVLYASGVGYFEHAGEIEGDRTVRLVFDQDQINDVLKSMVLMDLGGGRIGEVSYPSREPVGRALQSFAVDISGNPSLPELLNQLRGAKVTVHTTEAVTGAILNVTSHTEVVGNPPAEVTRHTLNLVTDTGITSIPLEAIGRLELADPKLRDELTRALTLLAETRNDDRKPVELRFEGEGTRDVRVGYLTEMPVWKTSYRLELSGSNGQGQSDGEGEGEGDAADGEAFLQGWAIVENTSESDWDGVELTLVSGQPISFTMDLYEPLFVPRPEAQVPRFASLRPRIYEEGVAGPAPAQAPAPMAEMRRNRAAGQRAEAEMGLGDSNFHFKGTATAGGAGGVVALDSAGVQSAANAAELGELFRYTLGRPIDLDRRKSAMLPILTESVEAERLSIYNQGVQAKHPLHGARLTNSTDLKLLGGPITVFADGAYAGDALIDHLGPGDEKLISYGIDLDVLVDPSQKTDTDLLTARIVKGVLETNYRRTQQQTYRVDNRASRERTILVEHPNRSQFNLVEPEEPFEKTPELYRFRVEVPAGEAHTLTVVEEQPYWQTLAILDADATALVTFARRGEISQPVREALQEAAELKRELVRLEQERDRIQQQLDQIKTGQERLRQNLESVGANTQLGQRYLTKLSEEEDQIESLQTSLEEARERVEAQRSELERYILSLNVQ